MELITAKPDNSPEGLFPDQTHEHCHVFGMPEHFIAATYRHWVTGVALEMAIFNNKGHTNPKLQGYSMIDEDMASLALSAEVCLEPDRLESIVREVAAEVWVDLEELIGYLNEGRS